MSPKLVHDTKKRKAPPKLARVDPDADVDEMDADELELLYWGSAFEVMLPKHAQG